MAAPSSLIWKLSTIPSTIQYFELVTISFDIFPSSLPTPIRFFQFVENSSIGLRRNRTNTLILIHWTIYFVYLIEILDDFSFVISVRCSENQEQIGKFTLQFGREFEVIILSRLWLGIMVNIHSLKWGSRAIVIERWIEMINLSDVEWDFETIHLLRLRISAKNESIWIFHLFTISKNAIKYLEWFFILWFKLKFIPE